MLFLAPMTDKEEIENVFLEKGIAFGEFSGCVTAKNGDELLGLCLYDLDAKKMTVHYIEPLNDIPLADGILRSTGSIVCTELTIMLFFCFP